MPDWDKVYSEKRVESATASDVLLNNSHLLPDKGDALDYACGLAGNAFYLAGKGFNVKAWDMSEAAINQVNSHAAKTSQKVSGEIADLENNPPKSSQQFDVIVVSYFLHRETLRDLYRYLKQGGILFYQTFSGSQVSGKGPSRDAFRLQRGELLKVFSDMQLLFYREDCCVKEQKVSRAGEVFMVARK